MTRFHVGLVSVKKYQTLKKRMEPTQAKTKGEYNNEN